MKNSVFNKSSPFNSNSHEPFDHVHDHEPIKHGDDEQDMTIISFDNVKHPIATNFGDKEFSAITDYSEKEFLTVIDHVYKVFVKHKDKNEIIYSIFTNNSELFCEKPTFHFMHRSVKYLVYDNLRVSNINQFDRDVLKFCNFSYDDLNKLKPQQVEINNQEYWKEISAFCKYAPFSTIDASVNYNTLYYSNLDIFEHENHQSDLVFAAIYNNTNLSLSNLAEAVAILQYMFEIGGPFNYFEIPFNMNLTSVFSMYKFTDKRPGFLKKFVTTNCCIQ